MSSRNLLTTELENLESSQADVSPVGLKRSSTERPMKVSLSTEAPEIMAS